MSLEQEFKKEIDNAKFSIAEVQGFQVKPALALLAGALIGYRYAIANMQQIMTEVSDE